MWIHGLTAQALKDIKALNLNAPHLVVDRGRVQAALRDKVRRVSKGGQGAVNRFIRGEHSALTAAPPAALPAHAEMRRKYLEPKLR